MVDNQSALQNLSRILSQNNSLRNQNLQARITALLNNTNSTASNPRPNTSVTQGPISNISNTQSDLIRIFDLNSDGQVSDQEAIQHFTYRRQIGLPYNSKIFGTNANAKTFEYLITRADTDGNGIFSNQEVQDSLLLINREGKEISDQNLQSLFKNSQYSEIRDGVNFIDKNKDGRISDLETLDAILQGKAGNFDYLSANNQRLLAKNNNLNKITELISTLNLGINGNISDLDVFNILMQLRQGGLDINNSALTTFLSKNPNSSQIEKSIGLIDSNSDGKLSPDELRNLVLNIKQGKIKETEHPIVLNTILSSNTQYQQIKNAIALIDTDNNGIVSDFETAKAIFAINSQKFSIAPDILDTVLSSNTNKNKIVDFIHKLDPQSNGNFDDAFAIKTILEIMQGSNQNLALLATINDASGNQRPYLDSIKYIDKDLNGRIDDSETLNYLLKNKSTTSLDKNLLDLVLKNNPNYDNVVSALNTIDQNHDNIIDDSETLTTIQLMRQNKLGINSSLALSILNYNPNTGSINSTINEIDSDSNGIISDKELAESLIKYKSDNLQSIYQTNKTDFSKTIAEKLFKSNQNYSQILNTYNKIVSDTKGNLGLMFNLMIEEKDSKLSQGYDILTQSLNNKLEEWRQTRKTATNEKLNSLLNHINSALNLQISGNADQKDKSQKIDSTKLAITTNENNLQNSQNAVNSAQQAYDNPPMQEVTTTDNKGQTHTSLEVNEVEKAKILVTLNAAKDTLEKAKVDLENAKTEAKQAIEKALLSIGISDLQKDQMQKLFDDSTTVSQKLSDKSNSGYINLELLIDNYYTYQKNFPPNYENILGKTFYAEFANDIKNLQTKLY